MHEVKLELKVGSFVVFEFDQPLKGNFYPRKFFLEAVNKIEQYAEFKRMANTLRGFERRLPVVKAKDKYICLSFHGFQIEMFVQPLGGKPIVEF